MNKLLFIVSLFVGIQWSYASGSELRIVSLAPSVTKQLSILGMKDNIVGCTSYCPLAKEKDHKASIVASVVKANLEEIMMLQPDYVFASSLVDIALIEKMKRLNIKVIRYEYPKSYQDICDQFLHTAELIGKKELAQQIVDQQNEKITAMQKEVSGKAKQRVFVEIGAKPLFTAIEKSFINDFIVFSGAENVAKGYTAGAYSREKVIEQNPDIILIVTMGIVGDQEKEIWERYTSLKATQNKKIFVLDSYKICSPTPIEFVEMLETIKNLIHSS